MVNKNWRRWLVLADLEDLTDNQLDDRPVVRCKHCDLQQYMTRDSNCRRCHMSLIAREVPKDVSPEPKPQPRLEVLKWGKALAELREQKGMTQRQFAAKAGIMRTHLCKIEKSQCKPTYATVVRLALALGIEINLLLTNSSMCAELLSQKLFLDRFVR